MDNKIRVHELAKQLKSTSKRILEMLNEMGIKNKSYMSVLEDDELQKFYEHTGFKSEKNTENSADDLTAKKIAAQKEQQTQGKSSGVIVRRIIVDNSSSENVLPAQKTQSGAKNPPQKKSQRQSREAGSGLRSGYEVRTESIEDLYALDLPETKNETEIKPSENTQENVEPVKAAASEPTVRRVKRVKREIINKTEEVPKTQEPEVPPIEIKAEEPAVQEPVAPPVKKEEKFVFKQYEYSEVINIELEEEPALPIEMINRHRRVRRANGKRLLQNANSGRTERITESLLSR